MYKGYWMHKNCLDVGIEVLNISYQDHKRFKIKAVWFNLGYTGNPWPVSGIQKIEISTKDAKDWVNINKSLFLKRNKPGVP